MSRQTLRNQASALQTAAARLIAKSESLIRAVDGSADLDTIGSMFGEAEKVAEAARQMASNGFDDATELKAAEWDAAWNARTVCPPDETIPVEDALRVIGNLHAAHYERPSAQIIPLPSARRLELVSDSNGAA